jgi:hypothetical protein
MPAGFAYPDETEIWGPLAFSSDDWSENSRGGHAYEVLGRIKPGLSLAQVQSDVDRVGRTMIEQHKSCPYEKCGFGIILHPLLEETVGDVKTSLMVLTAAVGLVLLIACANIANLLLARSGCRPPEHYTRFGVNFRVGGHPPGIRFSSTTSMRSTVDTAIEHEGIADPESESTKSDEGAINPKAVSLTGKERLFTLLSQRGENL